MAVRLYKRSSPEWEKTFNTREEALAELVLHICIGCREGEDLVIRDGQFEKVVFSPPNMNDIYDVLNTACGCEYDYEEDAE